MYIHIQKIIIYIHTYINNGNKKNEEDLINCNDKEIEKNCNEELKSFSENSKQAQKKENLEIIKLKSEVNE